MNTPQRGCKNSEFWILKKDGMVCKTQLKNGTGMVTGDTIIKHAKLYTKYTVYNVSSSTA